MKKNPDGPLPDFGRQKTILTLWLLGVGMGLALAWSFWKGFILDKGYPDSYVLGCPRGRFADFTDETRAATLANPYEDPFSFYSPVTFALFRAMAYSTSNSLIFVFLFSLVLLALLLTQLLPRFVTGAWSKVSLAFFFLVLSYPILFCLDRGNIEILMAPLIGWAIYFYSRRHDVAGTACLFPAICFKFYPAILLIVLLRRKKIGLAIICGAGVLAVVLISSCFFPASLGTMWNSYRGNLGFFRDWYVIENMPIEGSASPWNAYKVILIALQKMGFISPVNFNFDGLLIQNSYHIYSLALTLLMLICAFSAWCYERKLTRSIILLLLFISIAAPNGADYRLIYADMALIALMLLPRRRRGDLTALVLIALAVIPKKEVLLTFAGVSETGYADVSLQSLLNPFLILAAMGILLYHSRNQFDLQRWALRLHDLKPSRWRWF